MSFQIIIRNDLVENSSMSILIPLHQKLEKVFTLLGCFWTFKKTVFMLPFTCLSKWVFYLGNYTELLNFIMGMHIYIHTHTQSFLSTACIVEKSAVGASHV